MSKRRTRDDRARPGAPAAARDGGGGNKASDAVAPVAPAAAVTTGRSSRIRAAVLEQLPLAGVLAFVFVVHVWIISAGHMRPSRWPEYGAYYSYLADAFMQGQLYLGEPPNPRLLALPDPYDPIANEGLRLHDAVLFNGKYYMYWGPVPGLLLIPFRAVRSATASYIPDTYVVFAAVEAVVILSALLLGTIRRWYFPQQSRYTLLLMTAAAGLAMPLPCLLSRGAVYEASIVWGQVFLLAGIYSAFTAFPPVQVPAQASSARRRTASALSLPLPSPRLSRLALAGLCWSLAVGCRASLAIAVIGLPALVALRIGWRARPRHWFNWRALAALGVPLMAGAFSLAAYNHARFGSWTEFGQRYQLAAVPIREIGSRLFSAENVEPSLTSYLYRPWMRVPGFPYIVAQRGLETIAPDVTIPPYYHTEEIVGITRTTPLFVLLFVPPIVFARRALRAVTSTAADSAEALAQTSDAGVNWLFVCLLSASALAFVPVLFLIGSTMRYFADLTPTLFIAAAIGLWQLERALASRGRVARFALMTIATICTAYCIVVSFLLAILGYSGHFIAHNLPLFKALRATF